QSGAAGAEHDQRAPAGVVVEVRDRRRRRRRVLHVRIGDERPDPDPGRVEGRGGQADPHVRVQLLVAVEEVVEAGALRRVDGCGHVGEDVALRHADAPRDGAGVRHQTPLSSGVRAASTDAMNLRARSSSTRFQVMPSTFRLVPTTTPSATARMSPTFDSFTPVLANSTVSGSTSRTAGSCARATTLPVMTPETQIASASEISAAPRATTSIGRAATGAANSATMLFRIRTLAAPICRR